VRNLRILSLMITVLLTDAGAITLVGAALMICSGRLHLHCASHRALAGLRDPRLDFGFMVEAADDAFDNAAKVDAHIGLHGDLDVGAIIAGQSGEAVERLADRVQAGEGDLERILLLGLARDLINSVAQLKIGAAERLSLSLSLSMASASAAMPRAASLAMAFDEPSFKQLVRWR
jgi:hypothetical protein